MEIHHKLMIGMVAVVVLVSGAWFYFNANTPAPNTTSVANNVTTKTDTGSATGQTYTIAQVATHNNNSSCWSAINGGVYDLTSWISRHPGGEQAILSLCGTDGSAAFNEEHGGQRRPTSELASFKIGTLITQ